MSQRDNYAFFGPVVDDRGRTQYGIFDYSQQVFGFADTPEAAKIEAEKLATRFGWSVRELHGRRRANDTATSTKTPVTDTTKIRAAVLRGGAFDGIAETAPPVLHHESVAVGRLASWLTDEQPGVAGVFAISAAAAAALIADERDSYVIVNFAGSLAAMTLAEAYARHARETTTGVNWHASSGAHAVARRATRRLAND